MTLQLALTAPWPNGYSSAAVREPWAPGEVRTVAPEVAAYLLATFPGVFVEVPAAADADPTTDEAPAPAPEAPKRRRG